MMGIRTMLLLFWVSVGSMLVDLVVVTLAAASVDVVAVVAEPQQQQTLVGRENYDKRGMLSSNHIRALHGGDSDDDDDHDDDATSHTFSHSSSRSYSYDDDQRSYRLWEPQEISKTLLLDWPTKYRDFIHVHTSQEAFGLPRAGTKLDCPYDTPDTENDVGCLNYYFTLQDYVTHPEGSDSSNRLPEVLWSGAVHGDERVGPTAVLEAAQLLMAAAACEALPKRRTPNDNNAEWDNAELQQARQCRIALHAQYGLTHEQRQWLARILVTRRIVVVPTANALGYFRNKREENNVDPNRDFPYDLTDPRLCMQSIAARTLNEIARQHMFQLSLTFHGGMEVIGYEWGAPTYLRTKSPDDVAQAHIAALYSSFGGGWKQSPPYLFGDMNSFVYPVRGGMEDWAYAASWDPDRVVQCNPTTYGGYATSQTQYGPSTLRMFNMLVESSSDKTPRLGLLGTTEDALLPDSAGTGYVSRAMRLSLMAAELVEPYVMIQQVHGLVLSEDMVPLTPNQTTTTFTTANDAKSTASSLTCCRSTRYVSVPINLKTVVFQWLVGGANTVDNTQLWYGKWSDLMLSQDKEGGGGGVMLDCLGQPPDLTKLRKRMSLGKLISAPSGKGRFSSDDSNTTTTAGMAPTLFVASMDLSGFKIGDEIAVIAVARVDQNWMSSTPIKRAKPKVTPQSHVVNVRTNASWSYTVGEKVVHGRLDWISAPVTIVVREEMDQEDIGNVGFPATIELSTRHSNSFTIDSDNQPPSVTMNLALVVFITLLMAVGVALVVVGNSSRIRNRLRVAQRNRVRDFIDQQQQEDEQQAAFSSIKIASLESDNASTGRGRKATTSSKDFDDEGGYSDFPDHNGDVELT